MYPTPSNSTELQNCDENIVTNISNHSIINISQNSEHHENRNDWSYSTNTTAQ